MPEEGHHASTNPSGALTKHRASRGVFNLSESQLCNQTLITVIIVSTYLEDYYQTFNLIYSWSDLEKYNHVNI